MRRKTEITEDQALMIMHQYRLGVDSRETANYIGCSSAFISTFVKAFNGSQRKLDVLAKDHVELILRLSPFYNSKQQTDSIVESVISQYRERSEVGIKKYNNTMDRNDLSNLDWLTHLQQELMDATLYIEKLKKELR